MKFSLIFALILGAALTGICYGFLDQIARAFLSNQKAFRFAVQFSKILLITGPLFGIYYTILNALQAMNAAVSSFVVNVSRQGLVYLPLLFILNAAIGMNGLVWAQPAADLVSIALCVGLYAAAVRKNTRAV